MNYAEERGYGEVQVISDIGSGLNENGKGFLKLLDMFSEVEVSKVIVGYGDGLKRFGFEKLRELFSAFGTGIEVINHEEKPPSRGACRRPGKYGFPFCWEALRGGEPRV